MLNSSFQMVVVTVTMVQVYTPMRQRSTSTMNMLLLTHVSEGQCVGAHEICSFCVHKQTRMHPVIQRSLVTCLPCLPKLQ